MPMAIPSIRNTALSLRLIYSPKTFSSESADRTLPFIILTIAFTGQILPGNDFKVLKSP